MEAPGALIKLLADDSRKAVIPCFSSLSRCLGAPVQRGFPAPVLDRGFFMGHATAYDGGMLWFKAFHIVFVASWFSALFYLPRIFVNLAQISTAPGAAPSPERVRLLGMARRLHRFGGLLMVVALALGFWLWLGYGIGRGQPWMHVKLGLVLGAIGYQHVCLVHLKRFESGGATKSERWYRVFNEAAVLLFAATVVMVVVKPW